MANNRLSASRSSSYSLCIICVSVHFSCISLTTKLEGSTQRRGWASWVEREKGEQLCSQQPADREPGVLPMHSLTQPYLQRHLRWWDSICCSTLAGNSAGADQDAGLSPAVSAVIHWTWREEALQSRMRKEKNRKLKCQTSHSTFECGLIGLYERKKVTMLILRQSLRGGRYRKTV